MKNVLAAVCLMFLIPLQGHSQEITETNSDVIYKLALAEYHDENFERSLQYTQRGLELAPEYHDIRILQIRNLWALENFTAADSDLFYLLQEEPSYSGLNALVQQRINRFDENSEALGFIEEVMEIYPGDLGLQVKKSQLLLKEGQKSEARDLALQLMRNKKISGEDRYILQIILNRTVSNEIGINYQYINFSEEYSNYDQWHTMSLELQHNFGPTAVIGRVNYTDREVSSGALYELEAYPVFNDRLYAFTNIGFSDGSVYPDFRGSASIFYNFVKILESEIGGRLLHVNDRNYFTGIIGLTAYQGKFYLNARTFIGPKRLGQLIQNYQFNVRYYLEDADNYLFVRVGSGISPDERKDNVLLENPELEAYYVNGGINKKIGLHHIFQISAGFLTEDITDGLSGNQFLGNIGYRYRF